MPLDDRLYIFQPELLYDYENPKICPLAYKKMVTYLIPRAKMANQVPEISSRKLSLMETRLKKKQS